MNRRGTIFLAVVLALSLGPGFAIASPPAVPRPGVWATVVKAEGVDNLYSVEPGLFRSAQPTSAGFRELAALGVRTVLDVAGGEGDAPLAKGTDLKLLHVSMSAFGLRDRRVLEALRILADPANRPVVIHCQHGADRTGAIVALYRVVVQGWSKADALREMNEGGFHHSSLWRNLDDYVLKADVEALRREILVVASPSAPVSVQASAGPSLPAAAVAPAASAENPQPVGASATASNSQ